MVDPVHLSEGERRFVEAVGQHVELFGLPRIAGRTFALMMVAPRPLALEEIAVLLKVSRASVSINTRIGIATGVIELHSEPGDRRKYYRFSEHAFEHRIELLNRYVNGIRRILTEGVAGLAADNHQGRQRLELFQGLVSTLAVKMNEVFPVLLEQIQQKRSS